MAGGRTRSKGGRGAQSEDGFRTRRRTILGVLVGPSAVSLAGCNSRGSSCGPGETSIGTVADSYGEFVGTSVTVKGTTVDGSDPANPTVDDTTGLAYVRGMAGEGVEGGQCWRITGTVLSRDKLPDSSGGSSQPDVALEARAIERFYPHGHK